MRAGKPACGKGPQAACCGPLFACSPGEHILRPTRVPWPALFTPRLGRSKACLVSLRAVGHRAGQFLAWRIGAKRGQMFDKEPGGRRQGLE